MKTLLIIIIIVVVLVGGISSIFLYKKSVEPFLYGRYNRLFQVTFGGDEILFGKNVFLSENAKIGKFPYYHCEIYLKDIKTEEERLVKRFNFDCGITDSESLAISKNKKYILFDTNQDTLNKRTSNLAVSEHSIYVYDIEADKFSLIKEGFYERIPDTGYTKISYSYVRPSPTEDNKFLFTKRKSITLWYGEKDHNGIYENQTYEQILETWVYDLTTDEEILIYQENLTGESWTWPDERYHPYLTRWSPKGDAIIYEVGVEGVMDYKRPDGPRNNEQYIVYLTDLEVKELNPDNVVGDIDLCGYFYEGNLQPFYELVDKNWEKGRGNLVLFPDGKTYFKVRVCASEFCPGAENYPKYYLRESEEQYCTPTF